MDSLSNTLRRTLLRLGNEAALTDGQLLAQFVRTGEQASFEELVRRHGPMVLRLCRRVLSHAQDAEDAFQATFIVLARKAAAVARMESVAGWLHGVGCRTALNAKKQRARRAAAALQMVPRLIENGVVGADLIGEEWRSMLDEALQRLPEKYRTAIVLCYLEGKSNEAAAQLLHCRLGAVRMRLSRGRDMLRCRLARRGVALSGGMLAGLLAQEGAAAAPTALAASAARVAVQLAAGGVAASATAAPAGALAEAVLRSMASRKLMQVVAGAVLSLCLLCGAAAGIAGFLSTPQRPDLANSQMGSALEPRALRDGLVGHYAFNEGQGIRIGDASPTGNHGTLQGGMTWTVGRKPGSKALRFDGTTGYVKLDKDAAPWLGGTATLAFWIKTTQTGLATEQEAPTLFGCDVRSNNDVAWGWLDASGRVGIVAGNPAKNQGELNAKTKKPVNDGVWHHVALTRDAANGQVRVYADGVFQDSAISGSGIKTTRLTEIGKLSTWDKGPFWIRGQFRDMAPQYFRGELAEMRIYNRVLTAAEIRQFAQ